MHSGLETSRGSRNSAVGSRRLSSSSTGPRTWWRRRSDRGPRESPVGGGPGRPGRSLAAQPSLSLQRQRRGAAPYHPLWRRFGPGLSTAGSGLRTEADESGVRRVLHHGRRLQPCANSSCSMRWATPPRRSPISGPPATSSPWTQRDRTTCPRWATDRPRQPAEPPVLPTLGTCSPPRTNRNTPSRKAAVARNI